MTDKPIIFSGPMVRALLDGRKTQTRRLTGLKDVNERPDAWTLHSVKPLGYMAKASAQGKFGATFESRDIEPGVLVVTPQVLRYAPGDRLYVREAIDKVSEPGEVFYRADYEAGGNDGTGLGWRPSIHMPRWASRLTLTVTEVRVQRLQEISEKDAREEGCNPSRWNCETPRDHFRDLWNSLHGPDAWAANPWVAAISFTVERRNIDEAQP